MGIALTDARNAQHVRSGALHEPQVIRVVNDAGKVGILEINPARKAMLAINEASRIRQITRIFNHQANM